MIGDRSLYKKMQIVLDSSMSRNPDSIAELEAHIQGQELVTFYSRQYNEAKDIFESKFSRRTLQGVIRLCIKLGLILENGRLTRNGRQALSPERFNKLVAAAVFSELLNSGMSIKRINLAIHKSLSSNPVVLPSVSYLWERSESTLSYAAFSRYLSLLGYCGFAQSSQSKLILAVLDPPV